MVPAIHNPAPAHQGGAALPRPKVAGKLGVALPVAAKPGGQTVDIVDIRGAAVEDNLREDVLSMFFPEHGPRKLPTLLLYDEKGLQLFEQITYLDEYYLTNNEIEILATSAPAIVQSIPAGAAVVELGSGNLRKTSLILQALEDAGKQVDYYALDLSRPELERTLGQVPDWKHVRCHGLLGTYDDGRDWLKKPQHAFRPKCVMHLGSSIGNFMHQDATAFLKGFSDVLAPGDQLLIGVDACNDPAKVYRAYNDKEGLTHKFILNGLSHANRLVGETLFNENDWRVLGEYVCDSDGGRHQAFFAPRHNTLVRGTLIQPHERIQVEQSFKFSREQIEALWDGAGMLETGQWKAQSEYGLHMLSKPNMAFSLARSEYAQAPLPSLADWEDLWRHWDTVSRQMLPHAELLRKPIKLRNCCVFYLGHIPNFLDVQLSKATGRRLTEPAAYRDIFERGIDPDVDNPELCHAHSDIPDEWPPVTDILAYQTRVRARLRRLYERGRDDEEAGPAAATTTTTTTTTAATTAAPATIPRDVARTIWLGFEHEAMHLETLLYMVLQSDRAEPPAGVERPAFGRMAKEALAKRVANEWFDIPARELTIGMDDPEDGTDNVPFGWDNEKPKRTVKVHGFQAKGRPITNEEYAEYLYNKNIINIPASWVKLHVAESSSSNGHQADAAAGHGPTTTAATGAYPRRMPVPESFLHDKAVRTVFGPVPLRFALDWPVAASYNELAGCAAWMGGRIPTADEARNIYAYAEKQARRRRADAEKKLGKTVPAVNGHLSNNGVEETPPATPDKEHRASKDEAGDGGAVGTTTTNNTNKAIAIVKPARPATPTSPNSTTTTTTATTALTVAVSALAVDDDADDDDSDLDHGNNNNNNKNDPFGIFTDHKNDPFSIFTDLAEADANVGYRRWHPTAVTQRGNRLAGHAGMGGVWEWTSSPLVAHDDFVPMSLYPAYTADFFDGKHNVMLGGSWATIPRIAGRKSFVNFYQRNYPYTWGGARLVRDAK